jgi:hypothetical protein
MSTLTFATPDDRSNLGGGSREDFLSGRNKVKEERCITSGLEDLWRIGVLPEKIDFLKIDCEGGEYDIFTEENYEFLTTKVKYITGEWHLSYAEDGLNKFINFKNLYLKGKNNFRVFEPYDWGEVTHKILDDAYLHEFYNWRNPRNKGAQFMVYIDNG